MVFKVGDDVRVTLGNLTLQLSITLDHLSNLRLTLYYISMVHSYVKYLRKEESEEDLKTLQGLFEQLIEMQKTIRVGEGTGKEQWKFNLAKLAEIQFVVYDIAVKYDLLKYASSQYSEFGK